MNNLENFKELNSAVKLMVEWQKENKTQMENLTQTYSSILTGIEGIDKTLESSSKNHSVILRLIKNLKLS